jgi:riboflavin kinase/FMN adenylyltransferase
MQVERGLRDGAPVDPAGAPAVLTIGSYDGVHCGHVAILERVRADATKLGAAAVVMTFDPHPRCVLQPSTCPDTLTTVEEKAELLAQAGIDRLLVLPFDLETSHWSAELFLARLSATVGMARLVVGPDFAFGHKRQGDVAFLREWGAAHGVDVDVVEAVLLDGERVSSSRIRSALTRGAVEEAARLAGRWHFVDAPARPVDSGHHGSYRVAGLAVPAGKALPARGLYASWVRVNGRWWMAATRIEPPPTGDGGGRPSVEPRLFGFRGDLSGKIVRCCFVAAVGETPVDAAGGAELSGQAAAQVSAVLAATGHP